MLTTRREARRRIPIGEAVREMRQFRGLSQNALERKARRGGGYISMVESGELSPTMERLDEIAFALTVDTWELVQLACGSRRREEAQI